MDTNNVSTNRVGLYVKVSTRNRLNVVKAQLAFAEGGSVSQDEAINFLMEQYQKSQRNSEDASKFNNRA